MKRELTPEPPPQINAEKGCLHVLSTFLGQPSERNHIHCALKRIGDGQTRTEAIEAGEKALNHWRESATKAGEEMPHPLVHLDLLEILERIAFPDPNEERAIFASGWDACFRRFPGYFVSHGLKDATIGFEEALAKYQEERAARKKQLEEMIFGVTE